MDRDLLGELHEVQFELETMRMTLVTKRGEARRLRKWIVEESHCPHDKMIAGVPKKGVCDNCDCGKSGVLK